MKHKQYLTTKDGEPLKFIKIESTTQVSVAIPGYIEITGKQYRRLKWLERRSKIMERKESFRARASKIKKAMSD